MLEEFKKYVDNFYTNDKEADWGIKLKYDHSLRVKNIMEEMSKSFNQTKEEIEISKVIGLLHDYGRFYQWKKYHTFSDNKSVDHAAYGVKMLFENKEIKNFYQNENHYNIIKDAIYYHNKYAVKEDATIFTKMIRDADKIDILCLAIDELKPNEAGEISKEVINDFNNERQVDYKNTKNDADNVIKYLAFIYDINYIYSFKYIKEKHIIDNIYKTIKDKEKFKYYFDKINNYIDNKIKENDNNVR